MYDRICLTKSISKYEAVLHTETGFSNQLDHPGKVLWLSIDATYSTKM